MGIDLESFDDKNSDGPAGDPKQAHVDDSCNTSRRRFSRGALAGSAVLLSLGNRAAWGQASDVMGCMSVMTLNSFNPETGMFVSSPLGKEGHNAELASKIHQIADRPDYLGRMGQYQTCEDMTAIDAVCLVRGPKCP